MKTTHEFQGVKYLLGSAGSLILACPKCGEEHFREPENYFWSLVPKNKAWLDKGQKNYWGDPSWHKCMTCKTQMEPIRTDELESRWKPFWRSLGHKVTESSNAGVTGGRHFGRPASRLNDELDAVDMTNTERDKQEHDDLVQLAVELRELLFDDANGMMQGAMVGSPVECVAFAKWWIQRQKGLKPDQEWFEVANAALRGDSGLIAGVPLESTVRGEKSALVGRQQGENDGI